ncbi:MAG: ABC transporter ATP-binding protein [Archaeoglobaceae archaeon]|nr:ABC transporter ATP-binding protein [Archaeoglobaceae archaeon]MDW8014158.1 ABC transporter ATP-binding protein [Archaeoglobaceae archaeon]
MSDVLVVKNLYKRFGEVLVLDGISFNVKEGEFVSILGPSGCGKTTLLRIIAGLEDYEGEVLLENKLVNSPGQDRVMVFQDYALFPWKTVFENISFGLEVKKFPKKVIKERTEKILKLVGLQGFENFYPHEISGGMKQRVALARAIICEPRILLMDEPLSALDAQTRNYMQEELIRIWKEINCTILYVTHSIEEAIFLSDRIVVLTKRPAKVKKIVNVNLERPRDRFSNEFVRLKAEIHKDVKDEFELV